MNLTGTQISATYGNLLTIGTVAGTPTTGTLQNGAGSDLTSITLNGAAVFNEGGGDFDFRVEGQSAPNLLFVDASAAAVGIGTNAPDALLTVDGIASFGDGAVGTPSIANQGDLNTGLWFPAADSIAVSTGGAEAARVTANGAVLIGRTDTATATDASGLLVVDDVISMGRGLQQVSVFEGNISATTGTAVYTFTSDASSARFASLVKLRIACWANNNTPSNSPAAEYQFVLHKDNLLVTTINGEASIYEYTFDRATDFAFADSGSGVCTVTITNPTGQLLRVNTLIEILGGYSTNTTTRTNFKVTSVTYT